LQTKLINKIDTNFDQIQTTQNDVVSLQDFETDQFLQNNEFDSQLSTITQTQLPALNTILTSHQSQIDTHTSNIVGFLTTQTNNLTQTTNDLISFQSNQLAFNTETNGRFWAKQLLL
jgi:hypothetical protein